MKFDFSEILILTLIFGLLLLPLASLAVAAEQGLIMYFPLDEGKGDTITDASGLGYEGTINNAEWVEGKNGSALEFNGEDSFVVVEHQDVFDFTSMTAEVWIKAEESTGDYQFIISQWDSPESEWIFRINNEDKLGSVWAFAGEAHPVTKTIDENEYPYGDKWHHIATTFDDGEQKIYLDGSVVASTSYGGELPSGEDKLVLGQNGPAGGGHYKGVVDEVGLYNRALTQDEIKRDMNNGVGFAVVTSANKLSTIWGIIKEEY